MTRVINVDRPARSDPRRPTEPLAPGGHRPGQSAPEFRPSQAGWAVLLFAPCEWLTDIQ
jgi:hypothetical protein